MEIELSRGPTNIVPMKESGMEFVPLYARSISKARLTRFIQALPSICVAFISLSRRMWRWNGYKIIAYSD